MKKQQVDHNALLLQVMAHDLLAPLTAIKWQTELLTRASGDKQTEYLEGINQSTQLGINLTKHAHVAGRLLVGSYDPSPVTASLPAAVRQTAEEVRLQYERHGLALDLEVEDESRERTFDTELMGLYVWAVAKFYLSCTPAETTVSMRGMLTPSEDGGQAYVLVTSAPNIPEANECVSIFNTQEARGTYDQIYVFAKLLHTIAPHIHATMCVDVQSGLLVFETAFVAESTD